MAKTILVKRALHSVSVLLHDVDPQFTRSPEIELVEFFNDAQRAICKVLPTAGARTDGIRLKPGTLQSIERIVAADIKPTDGSTPQDTYGMQLFEATRNMGLDGLVAGRAIRVANRHDLDVGEPGWHSSSADVIRSFNCSPQNPMAFYVYPGASPARPWVEISWCAYPKVIPAGGAPGKEIYKATGNSTELIGIDDLYLDDLVNYTVARELMRDSKVSQNLQRAQTFAQAFLNSINMRVQTLTGNNPNIKVLPFAPENMAAAS